MNTAADPIVAAPADRRPVITVDPAVSFGGPAIKGVSTGVLADAYIGNGADEVCDDYDLTRHELLVALWFEATHGDRPGWRPWADKVAYPVLAGWRGTSVDELQPPDPELGGEDKADVLHADGSHYYWSTHCRHAGDDEDDEDSKRKHRMCATTTINGGPRKPAQCKICHSPCVCPCH
jgi:uncharacterized protein (DUF433 family)